MKELLHSVQPGPLARVDRSTDQLHLELVEHDSCVQELVVAPDRSLPELAIGEKPPWGLGLWKIWALPAVGTLLRVCSTLSSRLQELGLKSIQQQVLKLL